MHVNVYAYLYVYVYVYVHVYVCVYVYVYVYVWAQGPPYLSPSTYLKGLILLPTLFFIIYFVVDLCSVSIRSMQPDKFCCLAFGITLPTCFRFLFFCLVESMARWF